MMKQVLAEGVNKIEITSTFMYVSYSLWEANPFFFFVSRWNLSVITIYIYRLINLFRNLKARNCDDLAYARDQRVCNSLNLFQIFSTGSLQLSCILSKVVHSVSHIFLVFFGVLFTNYHTATIADASEWTTNLR